MYEMESLRNTSKLRVETAPECNCHDKRALEVALVWMTTLERVRIEVCSCNPAPDQLLHAGLFACAPVLPSLAVDIGLLDSAMRLFVNMPPNNTAWCNTLEAFLKSRSYKLMTQDALRRRFGNALKWYTSLRQTTVGEIDTLIAVARNEILDESSSAGERTPVAHSPSPPASLSPPASPTPIVFTPRPPAPRMLPRVWGKGVREETGSPASRGSPRRRGCLNDDEGEVSDSDDKDGPPQNPFPEPPPLTRPSDYLVARCPACFGSPEHDPSQLVDIHVCLDACFTQKRRKGNPGTLANLQKKRRANEQVDEYEAVGLKVPHSILDECETTFKAADEKREKASTKFFDDTALMGLLCRHDHVLWLVNMRTAGEKQYFALLLLETLFQHLPLNIRVGLLYDIVCQLHRSCEKFGFLDRYLPRLMFAVSVFHAFGHRWPCQLIYHPLKCRGFGFTNGEGCERFWHSISKLIGYLWVSGYHHRLYTLDSQIEHLDKLSLGRLAVWLLCRTTHCKGKHEVALQVLLTCGVTEDVLHVEWDDQVATQTKPLKRRSKNAGLTAVENLMWMRKKVEDGLQQAITGDFASAAERTNAELNIDGVRAAWKVEKKKMFDLERQLGIQPTSAVLSQLEHAEYYGACMQARAILERLRQKLTDRKFELMPIERSLRHTTSETQRNEHIEAAVKKCEPKASKLCADYNKLRGQLVKLIDDGKAPAGAVAPHVIPPKGIFKLDVDDVPPHWLADDAIRDEEGPQLLRERRALQKWFSSEWRSVKAAMEDCGGPRPVRYQLELCLDELFSRQNATRRGRFAGVGTESRRATQMSDEGSYRSLGEYDDIYNCLNFVGRWRHGHK
ncbi:hypothetical protein C8J57DRAFT_1436773 [Mycena rebaudengoi]|nr:hypothetical protein C8J57DRAFT_1436773 [Mycena rebaudengoi]